MLAKVVLIAVLPAGAFLVALFSYRLIFFGTMMPLVLTVGDSGGSVRRVRSRLDGLPSKQRWAFGALALAITVLAVAGGIWLTCRDAAREADWSAAVTGHLIVYFSSLALAAVLTVRRVDHVDAPPAS